MSENKVKILVGYHKPATLLKDDVFVPIHLGRALATTASKDGKMSKEDYQWMLDNMIGDDTGDNISELNRYFCETTAMYWAWKNYEKLGNPEYIGFMHYRRHFLFSDSNLNNNYEWGEKHIPKITSKYLYEHGIEEFHVKKFLNKNYYDIISTQPYQTLDSVLENYERIIPHVKKENLLLAVDIISNLFPEYYKSTINYINNNHNYWYHSFIMKIFELHKLIKYPEKINYSEEQRECAYIAERVHGAWLCKMNEEHKKITSLPISLIMNTEDRLKPYYIRLIKDLIGLGYYKIKQNKAKQKDYIARLKLENNLK